MSTKSVDLVPGLVIYYGDGSTWLVIDHDSNCTTTWLHDGKINRGSRNFMERYQWSRGDSVSIKIPPHWTISEVDESDVD